MTNTVAFDPGYGKNISSFINNIEYMYAEINKFKILDKRSSNSKLIIHKYLL